MVRGGDHGVGCVGQLICIYPYALLKGLGKARLGFHVGGIVVGDSHGINLDLGLGDLKVRSWNVSWTPGMKLRTQRAK